ncbi:hypothetical protein TorRG33x02_282440 [Trema orientale]|uniref:Uncharacterized protein n=1 Tax=Trema orientale TaxID=63057 RepID=A0A2P5CJJ9_TREOI|nr:hypothetical protein TorRG33x02_282440 [Trema orientale]
MKVQQPVEKLDRKDMELLDNLIITIDRENNKSGHQWRKDNKIGQGLKFLQRTGSPLLEYCTPKLWPIGPCHAKPSISNTTNQLKDKLAAKFIESFAYGKSTRESLLVEIKDNIGELKNCFEDYVVKDFDDGFLARLLFFDGCALLQFINSYLLDELEDKFGIDNHEASMIREDLFLLDNQIPYKVLELLVNLTTDPDQLKNAILSFLQMNNMMSPVNYVRGYRHSTSLRIKSKNADHLLDVLHSLILFGDDYVGNSSEKDDNTKCLSRCSNRKRNTCCLLHFCCLRGKVPSLKDYLQVRPGNFNKRFFRNVQELKSAGIKFKPSSGLATVYFHNRCFKIKGHLKLPAITVDESTERKLMNLVAYEMCLSGKKKNWYFVTSYIKLMDILVDKEQDVIDLRASRMLWNRLSTDVKVAQMFNNIGSICFEPPLDVYSNVKTDIQAHCERMCSIWMAEVYQDYFRSPWSILGLLAAAIVLLLTATQTWYAVNPKV